MTKKEIASYLNSITKDDLILHILKILEIDKKNKDYFESRINPINEDEILSRYKHKIEEQFYIKNNIIDIKYKEIVSIIREYKKISCIPENIADLMLYYVECGIELTNKIGDIDEEFYNNISYAFSESLKYIFQNKLQKKNERRCLEIHMNADGIAGVVQSAV